MDIAEFVENCPNYQKVKAEHQNPSGLLQEIQVPILKWEDIDMDFVVSFPWNQTKNNSIWVVVDSFDQIKSFYSRQVHLAEDY